MVLIYPDAIEIEQDQIRQCMYQRTTMNPHSFSYYYNYHKVQNRSESLVVCLSRVPFSNASDLSPMP